MIQSSYKNSSYDNNSKSLNLQQELERQYDYFTKYCKFSYCKPSVSESRGLIRKYHFLPKNGEKILMTVQLCQKLGNHIFKFEDTKQVEDWACVTIEPNCPSVTKAVSDFFFTKDAICLKINEIYLENPGIRECYLGSKALPYPIRGDSVQIFQESSIASPDLIENDLPESSLLFTPLHDDNYLNSQLQLVYDRFRKNCNQNSNEFEDRNACDTELKFSFKLKEKEVSVSIHMGRFFYTEESGLGGYAKLTKWEASIDVDPPCSIIIDSIISFFQTSGVKIIINGEHIQGIEEKLECRLF